MRLLPHPSPLTTRSLLEVGVPVERIKEILWGVDMNRAAPLSEHKPSSRVRFLFVGKISVHKGVHILREAWSRFKNPNASLTIVGEPIRPFEAELMREWAAQNDPRVRTIPEARPDIRAVYREADVFLFPSLVEGFGGNARSDGLWPAGDRDRIVQGCGATRSRRIRAGAWGRRRGGCVHEPTRRRSRCCAPNWAATRMNRPGATHGIGSDGIVRMVRIHCSPPAQCMAAAAE